MEKAGKGPTELAERLDTNKQNITRWSNGDRKLTVDWAKRLAPLLDTTADKLLLVSEVAADALPRGQKRTMEIPLLDTVTAGKLRAPSSQIPVEDVPLLAFADLGRGEFFALTVQGDSMDRISPDGSVIVVNQADRMLVSGKAYVISQRGEATFKLWRPDPPRFSPHSTNPVHEPIFVKSKADAERMVVGRVKRSVLDL
jgi:SOS-response transcriptional repressor LexA